jgi:hypothetical protein
MLRASSASAARWPASRAVVTWAIVPRRSANEMSFLSLPNSTSAGRLESRRSAESLVGKEVQQRRQQHHRRPEPRMRQRRRPARERATREPARARLSPSRARPWQVTGAERRACERRASRPSGHMTVSSSRPRQRTSRGRPRPRAGRDSVRCAGQRHAAAAVNASWKSRKRLRHCRHWPLPPCGGRARSEARGRLAPHALSAALARFARG